MPMGDGSIGSGFENGLTWAGIAVATPWTPYGEISQPTDELSIHKGKVFGSKEEDVHAVKTLSIRSTLLHL